MSWNLGMFTAQPDLDYTELVQLLQDIAANGASAFYGSDVATDIVAEVCALAHVYICVFSSLLLPTQGALALSTIHTYIHTKL